MTNQDREALPITIRGVTKAYGRTKALDAVDLDIKEGEFLTLLGPSGSGKTTLLMVLAGFTRPDCGSVLFGDKEVIHMPPHLRDVGMVFQSYALFPHMSVRENVEFGLKFSGFAKQEIGDRAIAGLKLVGLDGFGERLPSQLSGGQQQRVAAARALVLEPQVLLFDEPLSGLDPTTLAEVLPTIRKLAEQGKTICIIEHNLDVIKNLCDWVVFLDEGRDFAEGKPEDVMADPILAERYFA